MREFRATMLSAAILLGLTACTPDEPATESGEADPPEVVLGPVDGHDLPGTDLERVAAGDMAPDFGAGVPCQASRSRSRSIAGRRTSCCSSTVATGDPTAPGSSGSCVTF